MTRPGVQAALAGGVFLALVLLSMRPVLGEPGSYLLSPPDQAVARSDQQMVLATVIGHARTLVSHPTELRGTRQCYPMPRAYTLGEHMFGNGLLAALPYAVSGDPLISYNALVASTRWIVAMAMYLLVFAFTRSATAAFVAGVFACLTHLRISYPDHLFIHGDIWTPLALLFLYRLFDRRDWWSAAGLGLFFSLGVLESLYSLLSSAILLGVCGLFLLARHRSALLPLLPKLASAAAWVVGVAWFVFEPYLETAAAWSVLETGGTILAAGESFGPGRTFFPGVLVLVLALIGLADRLRGERPTLGADPRLALAVAALLLLWCSLRPVEVPGIGSLGSPILLLRSIVPGLDAVRVLAFVVVCFYLVLAILAGYGFHALTRRAGSVAPLIAASAAALVTVGVVVEHLVPSVSAVLYGRDLPVAVRFRPPEDQVELLERLEGRALIDLPSYDNPFVTADYLNASAYHGLPTAACYNSFGSAVTRDVSRIATKAPAQEALRALAALGFDTILVHEKRLTERLRRAFSKALESTDIGGARIERIAEAKGLTAYRIHGGEPLERSPRVLVPSPLPKVQLAKAPEGTIEFRVRNRGPVTFRHPDPIEPSELLIRWEGRGRDSVVEAKTRALLPVAIAGDSSRRWPLDLEVPVPPGRYEVSVSLADAPGRRIATQTVRVMAADDNLPRSPSAKRR